MNSTINELNKEKFVGTWKLVLYELNVSGGEVNYPFGLDAVGWLVYDINGHMFVQVMCLDRATFASGDRLRGTLEETKSAFEGYLAYFGTYEVNEEQRTVTHHIEGSLFPNWVGTAQKRFFEFTDDQLTLKSPPILVDGKQQTGRIIWKRVAWSIYNKR